MNSAESTRLFWTDPAVFTAYRAGRNFTAGVVDTQIGEAVCAQLLPGMRVVEMGAGDGLLSACVENRLPPSVCWVESDQSMEFLQLPRHTEHPRTPAEFPDSPFRSGSFDAVVCLSALDTLSQNRLNATLLEFRRILKAGGTVIHVLDMTANTDDLLRDTLPKGILPFPAIIRRDDGEEVSGVHFVNRSRLVESLPKIDQPRSIKSVMVQFISDFARAQVYTGLHHPEIFDLISKILLDEGLVESSIDSWNYFSDKVLIAAEKAGLTVLRNVVVEKSANVRRRELPKSIRDQALYVSRRFGISHVEIQEMPILDPAHG
jgi:ubiquinone/menaquinone biosynthesis C-methylase UbiE